jgi:hypothetical protein
MKMTKYPFSSVITILVLVSSVCLTESIHQECKEQSNIDWIDGHWARGCYFSNLNTFKTGKNTSMQECKYNCEIRSRECSHYHWINGECFLNSGSSFKSFAKYTNKTAYVCGLNPNYLQNDTQDSDVFLNTYIALLVIRLIILVIDFISLCDSIRKFKKF